MSEKPIAEQIEALEQAALAAGKMLDAIHKHLNACEMHADFLQAEMALSDALAELPFHVSQKHIDEHLRALGHDPDEISA